MSIREPHSQLFTEYTPKQRSLSLSSNMPWNKDQSWGSSKFCLQRPGSISPNLLFCFNSSSRKCNNYIQFHSCSNNIIDNNNPDLSSEVQLCHHLFSTFITKNKLKLLGGWVLCIQHLGGICNVPSSVGSGLSRIIYRKAIFYC